jgi:hypothetical protein
VKRFAFLLIALPELVYMLFLGLYSSVMLRTELGAASASALVDDGAFRLVDLVLRRPFLLNEWLRWTLMMGALVWLIRPIAYAHFVGAQLQATVKRTKLVTTQVVFGACVALVLAFYAVLLNLLERKLAQSSYALAISAGLALPFLGAVAACIVARDALIVALTLEPSSGWSAPLWQALSSVRRRLLPLLWSGTWRATIGAGITAALVALVTERAFLAQVCAALVALLVRAALRGSWLSLLIRGVGTGAHTSVTLAHSLDRDASSGAETP